jgi:hypothetical protein
LAATVEQLNSTDTTVVHPIYKDQIQAYFDKYNIAITWKVIKGGELNKTMTVSFSSSCLFSSRSCSWR